MAKIKPDKIKVFEALIGNEWKSWKADANASIIKVGDKVSIKNKVKSDQFSGVLTTDFDLSKLIAYSIGV